MRNLQALGVLDTPPEEFSESLVVAAAAIANTPISAISLVDTNRQWFKGAIGLNVCETTREVSFCAHAIIEVDPLIVPDAREDDRFSGNPLVTGEPFIRFYAGFPLIVKGHAVGALCIIDDRPRTLAAWQKQRLSALAKAAAAWLTKYQPGS